MNTSPSSHKEKNMKLIKRLNKLITADAHAVLDSIEDPHALLKQAMRDMQTIIEEDKISLEQTTNNLEKLKQQAQLFIAEEEKLNQELELCFSQDNELLARNVIKKKLYLAQRVELNVCHCRKASEKQSQLSSRIVANQQEFQLIAHQAEVLLSELVLQDKKSSQQPVQLNAVITDDDIEMALLVEKEKRGKS